MCQLGLEYTDCIPWRNKTLTPAPEKKKKQGSWAWHKTAPDSQTLVFEFSLFIAITSRSTDVRKIFADNTIIIYKNYNKNRLQILEAICIKNLKKNKHK